MIKECYILIGESLRSLNEEVEANPSSSLKQQLDQALAVMASVFKSCDPGFDFEEWLAFVRDEGLPDTHFECEDCGDVCLKPLPNETPFYCEECVKNHQD